MKRLLLSIIGALAVAGAALAQTNTNTVVIVPWSPSPRQVTMQERLAYARALGVTVTNALQAAKLPAVEVVRFAETARLVDGKWYVRTGTRRVAEHNRLWDYAWWLRGLCDRAGHSAPYDKQKAAEVLVEWAKSNITNQTVFNGITIDGVVAETVWRDMSERGWNLNEKFPPPVLWREEEIYLPLTPK